MGFNVECRTIWALNKGAYFSGGQSKPLHGSLLGANEKLVLRKQAVGPILPGAHAIEREFRVMTAFARSVVPVPRMFVPCKEKFETVLGRALYMMERLEGRLCAQRLHLAGMTPGGAAALRYWKWPATFGAILHSVRPA